MMAYSTEEVLRFLDSSDESEVEEDPAFILPHESDSEVEEPEQGLSVETIYDINNMNNTSKIAIAMYKMKQNKHYS